MPALDELLTPRATAGPADREVIEGELVLIGGERFARVDGEGALWGPVVGGEAAVVGDTIALVVSQDGTPFVVYPATGDGAAGPPGPLGPPGPAGSPGPPGADGSALVPRQTTTIVTALLPLNGGQSGTVTIAKGYRTLRIDTSHACRLRLYTTAAKRDADVPRPITDDPVGDHGTVLEFISTSSFLGADLCSPTPSGYSNETVPSGNIAYRLDNRDDAARVITVTLVVQAQET